MRFVMAWSMSVAVVLGEKVESKAIKAVLFTVKRGESVKVVWVAVAIKLQAMFHVSALLGDEPSS